MASFLTYDETGHYQEDQKPLIVALATPRNSIHLVGGGYHRKEVLIFNRSSGKLMAYASVMDGDSHSASIQSLAVSTHTLHGERRSCLNIFQIVSNGLRQQVAAIAKCQGIYTLILWVHKAPLLPRLTQHLSRTWDIIAEHQTALYMHLFDLQSGISSYSSQFLVFCPSEVVNAAKMWPIGCVVIIALAIAICTL